jgi:hypothetical protein
MYLFQKPTVYDFNDAFDTIRFISDVLADQEVIFLSSSRHNFLILSLILS